MMKSQIRMPTVVDDATYVETRSAVEQALESLAEGHVTFDFSHTVKTSLAAVPVLDTIHRAPTMDRRVSVRLPDSPIERRRWQAAGWVDFLQALGEWETSGTSRSAPLRPFSTFEDLSEYVTDSLLLFSRSRAMPTGTVDAIGWVLNELGDNVLVHGGVESPGLVQAEITDDPAEIQVVVVDHGVGVLTSMQEGYPFLASDLEALELAVQKGATRSDEIGQGNGISGTISIASEGGGSCLLHTGEAILRARGTFTTYEAAPIHSGLVALFSVPSDSEIDLKSALWGHVPLPAFEMQYLAQDGLMFPLREEATTLGTREAARSARTHLQNLMDTYPDEPVLIDFEGADTISSAFADEFVARMVADMGQINYFGRIGFANLSQFAAATIDSVIRQRLAG